MATTRGGYWRAYTRTMDLTSIVQSIDAEIVRLEQVRALLTDHAGPLKRGLPPSEPAGNAEG